MFIFLIIYYNTSAGNIFSKTMNWV